MKRSIARKWAKALESGEYKQGKQALRPTKNSFCCLGVLCNLHAQEHPEIAKTQKNVKNYLGNTCMPADEVVVWAGMGKSNPNVDAEGSSLASMNDSGRYTFKDIAKIIRKHYKEL